MNSSTFNTSTNSSIMWMMLTASIICNPTNIYKCAKYSLASLLRLLGSGVNAAVSTALGITDTRSQWTLALSTVFSFLCKKKSRFYKMKLEIHKMMACLNFNAL